MIEGPNKQQTASSPPAVCPICKGVKKIKSADGITMLSCYLCRGTGQTRTGSLSTK